MCVSNVSNKERIIKNFTTNLDTKNIKIAALWISPILINHSKYLWKTHFATDLKTKIIMRIHLLNWSL